MIILNINPLALSRAGNQPRAGLTAHSASEPQLIDLQYQHSTLGLQFEGLPAASAHSSTLRVGAIRQEPSRSGQGPQSGLSILQNLARPSATSAVNLQQKIAPTEIILPTCKAPVCLERFPREALQ